MEKSFLKLNLQLGQTLIETMAALFILVMGVSAAVGLAVYAFSASSNINKQIIATGLAREGMEAVRNMRDTNWLNDTLVQSGCYDYAASMANYAPCYQNWLGKNGSATPPYCINPSPGASCNGNDTTDTYYLGFNSTQQNLWVLTKDNSKFGLTFDPTNAGTGGFYSPSGTKCTSSTSDYCRKIIITNYSKNNGNASNPPYSPTYNQDNNLSLLEVQSEVWWVDKKCPRVDDFSSANSACRIELDTYLTNWKNY
jgi:Tfp pilus assembly protein PilV